MNTQSALFDLEQVFRVDDYLYFYGESLTEERSDTEVAGLVKLLGLDHPMTILDVACGHGRHANRLAALGHQVTGVDITPGFLEIARQEAIRRGLQVNFRLLDMRSLDYENIFDRATLLFTAFGYFKEDENLLVLKNIVRALKPGGLFLLDAPNRDSTIKHLQPYHVTDKAGNLMIDRNSFDTLTGLYTNQRVVIKDGVRRDLAFTIRVYNPTELGQLCSQAGLQIVQWVNNWEGEPLSTESRRMILITQKPIE